jgi:hypothetical protein
MTEASPRVATVAWGVAGALEAALASDAEWLWLRAQGAEPRDDALAPLLAAVEPEGAARATVLAGIALDKRGQPLQGDAQPAPAIDSAEAVRLVERRLLPLRSAGFANTLVERSAFERHGVPDARRFGRHAPAEWTARVLRTETGYIVPASVVVIPPGAGTAGADGALSELLATARMLRTGTWTRGDSAGAIWHAVRKLADR